jgi:hypothetical protein
MMPRNRFRRNESQNTGIGTIALVVATLALMSAVMAH